jgi:glutamate--cysteine ligase catalytic subunit
LQELFLTFFFFGKAPDVPLSIWCIHVCVCFYRVLLFYIQVDDATSADHFENIQSTNWQTCRWKPPPASSSGNGDSPAPAIGWRTEFRPMEVQVTDFENAAFSVLVVLVTRVILAYDLMLYIPMSLVDENMARATKRNAVLTEKFWFRKDIAPPQGRKGGPCDQPCGPPAASASPSPSSSSSEDSSTAKTAKISDCGHTEGSSDGSSCCDGSEFEEMTAAEILLGKGDYYPGLLPLVYAYLDHIKLEPGIKRKVSSPLNI